MEELEEGEACSYMNDDPNVDPDISLAYIVRICQYVYCSYQVFGIPPFVYFSC